MTHSRVTAVSFAAVLSQLAGIAASLVGPLPARGGEVPLAERVISTVADGAVSVFATDVDGDGHTDVLSASAGDDRIAWYESDGGSPPSFTQRLVSTAVDPRSVFAADVDGDGNTDVLATSFLGGMVVWYESDGGSPPTFTEHVVSTTAIGANSVFAMDMDGDGDTDVLSASAGDDKIAWYESDGGSPPSFTQRVISITANGAISVVATDVDGDGNTDVLSASQFDDKIAWYQSDGGSPPSFTERVISTSADFARSVFGADVDGDGDTDVLSASASDDKIAWYESDGGSPPSFTERAISTTADGAVFVFATDVDGDADTDVLSASFGDDKIAWYESNGGSPPSFTEHVISTTAIGSSSVFATDVDGDGDTDVLSASLGDDKIAWYENTPDLTRINLTAEVALVDDPQDLLGGAISVGQIITGSYIYDSATQDSNPSPTIGDYLHSVFPNGITVDAGGLVFRTDPDNVDFLVEILNDHGTPPKDGYLVLSYRSNLPLDSGVFVEEISWQLDDPTGTALSSEAIPTEPPVLADWESLFGLTMSGCDDADQDGSCFFFEDQFLVRAQVTSVAIKVICSTDAACDDQDICTLEFCCQQEDIDAFGNVCGVGDCIGKSLLVYADVNNDGFSNTDDLNCILDSLSGSGPVTLACCDRTLSPDGCTATIFPTADAQKRDIAPCPSPGAPDNMGDGFVNTDDLNAVLDVLASDPLGSVDPLCLACNPPPGAVAPSVPWDFTVSAVDEAALTLVPSPRSAAAGDAIAVDVFIDEVANLRSFQVTLEVIGGRQGLLTVESVTIDDQRRDYAFNGVDTVSTTSVSSRVMLATLPSGGVEIEDQAYLGTYGLRASPDAAGVFNVRIAEDGSTFLRTSQSEAISVDAAPIRITIAGTDR